MSLKERLSKPAISVKCIGIGAGGVGVINRMRQTDSRDMDLIAVYTDKHSASCTSNRIQIRELLTRRQAVCIDLDTDSRTIEERLGTLTQTLAKADMVLIAADMGSYASTCAASILAGIARKMGVLTIGVVTKPFAFEGRCHVLHAEKGVAALLAQADSLAVIPSERLKYACRQQITRANAFEIAGGALYQAVQTMLQTILSFTKDTGMIHLDFDDVVATMRNAGMVYIGAGRAAGEHSAEAAAKTAIGNPLMELPICRARRLLVNITGPERFGLDELERAADVVQKAAHPNVPCILNFACDNKPEGEICVAVVAAEQEAAAENDAPYSVVGNL